MLNSDLMKRYRSQQTSITSNFKPNEIMCVFHKLSQRQRWKEGKKGQQQSLRIILPSTQSYLFFACLPFDDLSSAICANRIWTAQQWSLLSSIQLFYTTNHLCSITILNSREKNVYWKMIESFTLHHYVRDGHNLNDGHTCVQIISE